MSNEITAYFKGRSGVAESVYQYDYGKVLIIDGLSLPATFEVHFTTVSEDDAITVIGQNSRVAIPDSCINKSGTVTAYIYLHTGENDGETEYVIKFAVIRRAKPDYDEDDKSDWESAASQALAMLQNSKKVNTPLDEYNQVDNGTAGQLLRTKGDGSTEWVDEGLPTDEQTAAAVSAWLDEHPEATTTVEDGSLTEAKLSAALKLKVLKDYVTPEMFGAKGDGVTDDTEAIHNMCTNSSGKPMLLNGTYLVTGGDIFNYLDNERELTDFILHGNNSTILWESSDSDDSLFKFNWKVGKIVVNELVIKCQADGGNVFEYYGNTEADVKAGAVSSHIYDVTLTYNALGDVYYPDYVFYIHGYGHCDKMLIEKCEFAYFKNFYYSENKEAVNNTFFESSFFTPYANATYFDFMELHDNFNVLCCSFSLYAEQTLLKNHYGTNPNNFYFNFAKNRYELFGTGTYVNLIDAQFGVITFTDENFTVSGFYNKQARIITEENAAFEFTNCVFNDLAITIGEVVTLTVTHNKIFSHFKECAFAKNPQLTYEGLISRKVVFLNCDFIYIKNFSYNAFQEGRAGGDNNATMFIHTFNSLRDYSALPPLYYAEKVRIRRLTSPGVATDLTVNINGTDYTVTVAATPGSEAVVPFIGEITSISTDKSMIFNIIVESSVKRLTT